jgi:3-deoxy-7-phosphoheptulonate synthase
MGIKNSVDGNIRCAAAGIATARAPHTFLHTSDEGRTELVKSRGNPYAHLVLRGSEDQSNYSKDAINEAVSLLRQMELPPKVIVDCSHGNSGRQYFKQKEVFESLLERGLDDQVVGLMIESHLEAGRQKVPSSLTELQRGVSITDGCLDYQSTEEMILSSLVPSLSS